MVKNIMYNNIGKDVKWLEMELPFPFKLVRRLIPKCLNKIKNEKIIFIHFEEPLRTCASREAVYAKKNLFDIIFTTDKWLVNNISHAYFEPLAESWLNGSVPGSKNVLNHIKEKDFSISFLITAKRGKFFDIRHEIWKQESNIKIPTKFFDSGRNGINDGHSKIKNNGLSDKLPLYHSMFNICPENFGENEDEMNWSQRLIDCFLSKTIPIYRGYKKIGDFFNLDGIIFVNDSKEAIEKINNLSIDYYISKKEAIEDNYNRVLKYGYNLNPGKRIEKRLLKICNV